MKQIAGLVTCFSLLGFVACSSDSSGNSLSATTSLNTSVDEAAQTITTYSPTCSLVNDKAVYTAAGDTDVASYVVRNDSLLITEDGEEDPNVYLGSSSDIFGTWTMTNDYYTMTLKIGQNSVDITESLSDDFCAMDVVESDIESELGSSDEITFTKTSCTQGTGAVNGISFTVKVPSFSVNGVTIVVSYNGSSCKLTEEDKQITASLCTVANLDSGYVDGGDYYESNYSEFESCVEDMMGNASTSTVSKKFSGAFSKALLRASKKK